jgi:hypothetical protein
MNGWITPMDFRKVGDYTLLYACPERRRWRRIQLSPRAGEFAILCGSTHQAAKQPEWWCGLRPDHLLSRGMQRVRLPPKPYPAARPLPPRTDMDVFALESGAYLAPHAG